MAGQFAADASARAGDKHALAPQVGQAFFQIDLDRIPGQQVFGIDLPRLDQVSLPVENL